LNNALVFHTNVRFAGSVAEEIAPIANTALRTNPKTTMRFITEALPIYH
jgi:hypothetical protein